MDNFAEMVSEAESLRPALPVTNAGLALDIARRAGGGEGWRVFPCHETHWINPKNGKDWIKSPYGDLCPNGKDNATKDLAIIAAWWKRHPGALVGILCDETKLVLDLDCHPGRPNGIDEYRRLNREINGGRPVNCGVVQKTMSGGLHLFFALPLLPAGYRIPSPIAPGIDVKANNSGYVCTGKLPDGGGYEWLMLYQNYLTGLCYPPLWVVQMIAQHNAPQPKRESAQIPHDATTEARLAAEAIRVISISRVEDYNEKIKVGMALTRLGDYGLRLWHDFCSRDTRPGKYIADEIDAHWKRIQKNRVTLGTLFYFAKTDDPNFRISEGK